MTANDWALAKGLRILGLEYGLASSSGAMLDNADYFSPGEIYSHFTNWDAIQEIEFTSRMDAHLYLEDDPSSEPSIEVDETTLRIRGPLQRLESEIQDRRWAILGNQGLWFRQALAVQERHGIYAMHAASIYKPSENHLVILLGKAGSGKTAFLLSAIEVGWLVFSTEMTYCRFESGEMQFLRGSLMDNIYVGTLTQDFPEARSQLGVNIPPGGDRWQNKVSVDMNVVAVQHVNLVNPTLSFLFPHVERGLAGAAIHEIEDDRTLRRRLYENASEKIGASLLLHEELPVVSLDTALLASERLNAIHKLLLADIRSARAVSAAPANCLEGLPE